MARRRSIIRQFPACIDPEAAAWYAWIYAEMLRQQDVPLDRRIELVQQRYARFNLALPDPKPVKFERLRDKIYAHSS